MLVGAGLVSLISITYGARAATWPRAWDCVTGRTESSAQPEPQNNGSFEPHNNGNTNRIYVNHRQFPSKSISSCTDRFASVSTRGFGCLWAHSSRLNCRTGFFWDASLHRCAESRCRGWPVPLHLVCSPKPNAGYDVRQLLCPVVHRLFTKQGKQHRLCSCVHIADPTQTLGPLTGHWTLLGCPSWALN